MRNNASILWAWLVFFATHLPHSTTTKCTDPRWEILDATWRIYINLPHVQVRSCEVTKTKTSTNCLNSIVSSTNSTTYYDITRNCSSHERNKKPDSFTVTYDCDKGAVDGNRLEVTEKREVKTQEARVNLKSDQLFLPSGTICKYRTGFCFDKELIGYTWDTHIEDDVLCENLVSLGMTTRVRVVNFTLKKEYVIFEATGREGDVFPVHLDKEVAVCKGRGWMDSRGVVVTNDSAFSTRGVDDNRHVRDYFKLRDKRETYQALVDDCLQEKGLDLYFWSVVALLAFAGLQIICWVYGCVANYMTLRKVKGGACKCLLQSCINRLFLNHSLVAETKLRSDIEMSKMKVEERPSYYEFRRPGL